MSNAINPFASQGIGSLCASEGATRLNNTQGTPGINNTVPSIGQNVLNSIFEADLPDLPASMRGVSLEQIMKAIADEARRAGVQSAVEALEVQGDELKAAHEEKLEALKKQIDEMSQKDFWSGFCKVFQIIGAVVGAIASVATTVVGAITGNPFMVAAGVIGATMAIDSTISLATDGKASIAAGFTELGKACGMDDETAKWFGFGMNMAITVVAIGVSFGVAGGVSAASKGVDTAAKSMEALATLSKISVASNAATGITGVASGVGSAVLAVIDYKIANIKADQIDIDALLEQLRSTMKASEKFIESEMKTAETLINQVMDIVEDCNATATSLLTVAPTTA